MTAQQNLAIVQRFLQQGDLSAMAVDAVFTDFTLPEPIYGNQAISDHISKHYDLWFRDGGAEFTNIISGEKSVVMEFTFRGIHQVEWRGISPTGKAVEIPMCVIYDLENGQITRGRLYYDQASMQSQLGLPHLDR